MKYRALIVDDEPPARRSLRIRLEGYPQIEIAADHKHVDVVQDLDVKDIKRMGLAEESALGRKTVFHVPPDLRGQLGSQGITGVKFVSIDFFDPKSNPPPPLLTRLPSTSSVGCRAWG